MFASCSRYQPVMKIIPVSNTLWNKLLLYLLKKPLKCTCILIIFINGSCNFFTITFRWKYYLNDPNNFVVVLLLWTLSITPRQFRIFKIINYNSYMNFRQFSTTFYQIDTTFNQCNVVKLSHSVQVPSCNEHWT